MVLTILISSKGELLDAALRPPQVLLGVSKATVLSIKFRRQFPNACLHLVHGLLASLQSIGLCFIKAGLHVLDLAFKQLPVLLIGLSKLCSWRSSSARRAASTI